MLLILFSVRLVSLMPTLVTLHSSACAQFKPLKFFELKRDLIFLLWRKAAGSEPGAVKPDMLQQRWNHLPIGRRYRNSPLSFD